ncbi:iron permease ftr1 family protein [Paramyrothecium foliicola]|nr:iron permease ftr1 family protein [Paramyrothecium foliicola]
MLTDFFSAPVFLLIFRETLETAIIVSVLLAFLKQTLGGPDSDARLYKTLQRQVWLGTAVGFLICLVVAAAIVGVFYSLGRDAWADHEYYYEAVFSLAASILITIMGVALLRIGRLQEKWRVKLIAAMEQPKRTGASQPWLKHMLRKYAMFVLPFITILREGIEGIVFAAGISFSAPATALPLSIIAGLLVGALVGYVIYQCVVTRIIFAKFLANRFFVFRAGSTAKIHVFLVISTCFLYLIAAGLFSRAVWFFEAQQWNKVIGGDAAELGDGPGSYDIDKSVWHVNCCSPQLNGGGAWGILNAIFGWTNSATYGSVISYNIYWVVVISGFLTLRFHEKNGRYPWARAKVKDTNAEAQPLLT